MNTYSSTAMRYYTKHCGAALQMFEDGVQMDRELFQVGIAAHAVLQEITEKRPPGEAEMRSVAQSTMEEIITYGRSYNGRHEPPMAPDHAIQGRDLAVNWVLSNGYPGMGYGDGAESQMCRVEEGFAIDSSGEPVGYGSEDARWQSLIDVVYSDIGGDEECQYNVLVVRDYKSAWTADSDELKTLQRKGQALTAWKTLSTSPAPDGEPYHAIRLEVCNLRTGMTHDEEIIMDDAGEDILDQWQADILSLCKAADTNREARPGANCLGCPFVLRCDDCLDIARLGREQLAESFAAAQAVRDELFAACKQAITDGEVYINGGSVGYTKEVRRVLADNGHDEILSAWNIAQGDPEKDLDPVVLSLIKALSPGVTQVKNLSRVLFPGRGTKQDRESFENECLKEVVYSKFGIRR